MFRTHRNDSRRLHPSGVSARSERLVGTQGARDPWVSNPIGVARGSLGADLCRASARASVAKCTYSILRTALVLGKAGSQGQGFAPDLSESSVPSSLPPRLRSASRALVRPLPPPEAGPKTPANASATCGCSLGVVRVLNIALFGWGRRYGRSQENGTQTPVDRWGPTTSEPDVKFTSDRAATI